MPIGIRKTEQPPYTPVEPGEYKAKVTEVEEEPDGQYGPQVRFTFEILDDSDYEGTTLRGWAALKEDDAGNYTFWDGTKLYTWALAMLGNDTSKLDDLTDLDQLKGNKCRVIVVNKTKQDGSVRDSISEVLAPKQGKAKGSAPKAAEAENQQDFNDIPF
jgi:hypothetical protein